MEHYVGLDGSLKLTAICIVDRTGKIEREGVVSSDPKTIATFIKSPAPHVARVYIRRDYSFCHVLIKPASTGWRSDFRDARADSDMVIVTRYLRKREAG